VGSNTEPGFLAGNSAKTGRRKRKIAMSEAPSVLVVDDEESIRWSLSRFLSDAGFQVEVASHAGEAKEMLSGKEFQAAVIDRILPEGQDGVDLIKYLNRMQPDCQSILISASHSMESAAETLLHDTFAFLPKPVHKDQICRTVEAAVRHGICQKERKKSEALFHSIFDRSPHPVLICDLLESTVFINPAFSRVFGFEAGQVIGKRILFVPAWDLEKTTAEVAALLLGQQMQERRTQRLCSDGRAIDVAVTSSLCLDECGKPKDILFTLRDLRESSAIEKNQIQSMKMDAIATLAAGIAHDFNNLLQVIVGRTEILLLGKGEGDRDYAGLRKLQEASSGGIKVVNQLYRIGRMKECPAGKVDVNEVIGCVSDSLRDLASRGIKVDLHLEEHLPGILGDAFEIEELILNLCTNARDAILEKKEKGGSGKDRILIRTGPSTGGRKIKGSDREILISVSDTGTGIPEETRGRIFDPFFTTKGKGKGKGLGLSFVYRIVQRHKGEIEVESVPGEGSIFKIYLPAAENGERMKKG
jgi:two-component system, cell cycle sensor histidine kinase and response regulator CckA